MEYEKCAEFLIGKSSKEYLFSLFRPYLKQYGSAHGFNQMCLDNHEGLIGELGIDVCWTVIFSDWEGNYLKSRPKRKYRPSSKISLYQWQVLQEKYDYRCFYCGKQAKLTKDHVLPVSKGGEDTIDNIVPACLSCNRRKGVKLLETTKSFNSENT